MATHTGTDGGTDGARHDEDGVYLRARYSAACLGDLVEKVVGDADGANEIRLHDHASDDVCPADRFRPAPDDDGLELWAPPDLEPVTAPVTATPDTPVTAGSAQWPDAIETDRVVPASGNMAIGPQQFWLGPARTGQQVRFWIDIVTVHLSVGGWRIKTVPSRLSAIDIARLRQAGARPA